MSVVSPTSFRTDSANDMRSCASVRPAAARQWPAARKPQRKSSPAGVRPWPSPISRAAAPRMASRRPARAPQPRSRAACVSRLPMAPDGDAAVISGAMRKSVAARSCSASSLATPTRQRASSPRSGGSGGAASRRAAEQSTRNRPSTGRRLKHDFVGGEDAAIARRQPERREVLRRSKTDAARQIIGLGAEQRQKIAVRQAEVQGGGKDAVNAHRKFAARDVRSQRCGPPDSVSRRSHGRSREPP